jgi:NTP pyrophosphatase (non-canonical NTP hydrolase)
MAHRLIKKHMNEAVEIAEAIDLEKNAKITKHSQAAVAAERRGDKHAQQFHLAIVAKLKNESVEVTEGTEETDGSEEVSMAKSQLLKVVDMAKDLANAMDDEDELEAWIQNKITTAYNQLDDVHSYVEYGEDLQDEKHDTADKDTPMDESVIGKETEEDGEETAGMSDKEKKSLARLQALIRLGLLDRQRLPIIARAIKKLDTERPINNIAEKLALFELLHSMIAIVTGDTSVFAKVRSSVIRK